MKTSQALTTVRAAEIFDVVVSYRGEFCADTDFIKMTAVWDDLCAAGDLWRIKRYDSAPGTDYDRKASVIAVGHNLVLTVDSQFWRRAERGEKLPNYVLAHELGHVILGHHAKKPNLKHFNLGKVRGQTMGILPPNLEEKEASFAGVIFQSGNALADMRWDATRLAERAFSDVREVKNAQRFVQLDVF